MLTALFALLLCTCCRYSDCVSGS